MKEKSVILEYLLSRPERLNLPGDKIFPIKSVKNNSFSEKIRMEGNYMFSEIRHTKDLDENIWNKYCLTIATAAKGSFAEALGYSRRSAFLFHLSKYKEAFDDLERAIQITRTNESKFKFLCRQVKCLIYVDRGEAKKVYRKAKSCLQNIKNRTNLLKLLKNTGALLYNSRNRQIHKIREVEPFKIKRKTNDFSSVTIKFSLEIGTHLVASRNIEAGEVIFVEKPCITFLNCSTNHAYCGHCLTICWNLIPCDKCAWTMYCSEKCKEDAWTQYHDMECSVFINVGKQNLTEITVEYLLVGLKFVITEYRKAGSITSLQRAVLSSNIKWENIFNIKNVKKDEMNYIFSFTQDDRIPDVNENFLAYTSIDIMTSLAKYTKFFGKKFNANECKNLHKNQDVIFIGALTYKLLKVYYFSEVTIFNGNDILQRSKDVTEVSLLKRGHCISTIFQMIQYSCDPNVEKCFTNNNLLVVYAIKPIKKNEEFFSCKSLSKFSWFSKNERKERARKKFITNDCWCVACKKNWDPLIIKYRDVLKRNKHKVTRLLFKSAAERDLYRKHEAEFVNIVNYNEKFKYTKKMIQDLSRSLKLAIKKIPQPLLIICLLTESVRASFEKLYTKCLWIPACNKR